MGIAALVLGIVSIILGFIPFCGMIALVPAIIGLILGIVDLVKKSKSTEEPKPKKGMPITGIVLSALAIIIILVWTLIIGAAATAAGDYYYNNTLNTIMNNYDSNETLGTVNVGQTYTDDEIKITFVSANDNFTDYSKYATIGEGNKVVKAEFDVENLGTKELYVSSYNFNCYADGYACSTFYNSSDSSNLSSTLSTNKKTTGSVYFEVPANATNITIEYTLDSYTNDKVEFVVK